MLLREDQLQIGRMRQLINNKRRAERRANRALLGDVNTKSGAGNLAAGRAPATAATRTVMEATAFAAEHVVAKIQELEFGYGRRNPNAGHRKRR
jgi:hypothetical protein